LAANHQVSSLHQINKNVVLVRAEMSLPAIRVVLVRRFVLKYFKNLLHCLSLTF